ncbi:MAG TPA: hypothetical protein G4N92_02810 [Anaerolineae bacterium]|nr:hypothetical protein [Anaerolineae bacterium]
MTSKKTKPIVQQKRIHPRSLKEQQQTRKIIIGFAITVAVVVGMIGYGLLYNNYLKYKKPIAIVGGIEISGQEFNERVRLERNAYISQYQMLAAQYSLFSEDPNMADYYKNQMLQILSTLDNYDYLGEAILNKMIEDYVVSLEADKLGINVSEEELESTIQSLFHYYPNGTPTPIATTSPISTSTLSATQLALLKYTPTPEATAALESTLVSPAVITPTAIITPTEMKPTQTSSETLSTPTQNPTATPYTLELFQQNYLDNITDLNAIGVSEDSLRKYFKSFLLNQKLYEHIVKDVPRDQEQVWARHILVDSDDESYAVLNRLESGEDWVEICTEFSLDTSNKDYGGDLGWFSAGMMVEEFEHAAFELKIGQISSPIETQFGWHVIQVLGHEVRPLEDSEYKNAQQTYFSDWFESVKEKTEITQNRGWRDHVPTEPSIALEMPIQQ